MSNNNPSQEFSLEDIMQEFASATEDEAVTSGETVEPDAEAVPAEMETPEEIPQPEAEDTSATQDTIRLDDLHEVIAQATEANRQAAAATAEAEPVEEVSTDATIVVGDISDLPAAEKAAAGDAVTDDTIRVGKPVAETYSLPDKDLPPPPIVFTPRSRLRELKKKLVEGPEKRYYDLTEIGLSRVQAAIFMNMLIVLLCAGATALFSTVYYRFRLFHMVGRKYLSCAVIRLGNTEVRVT